MSPEPAADVLVRVLDNASFVFVCARARARVRALTAHHPVLTLFICIETNLFFYIMLYYIKKLYHFISIS
jgi:hypothetical protein